jgi:two-component system copper resistance phosphate regulon response regulator CusR
MSFSPKQRVLVVEDDPRMLALVCQGLREVGHTPMPASDGDTGLDLAMKLTFDSIVLDIGLPGRDGYSIARAIRSHRSVPILMLTARDGEEEILRGFDHGADDYLTKPFSFRELLARLDVLGRAASRQATNGLHFDPARLLVYRNAKPIQLTRSEYLLLSELHRRSNSTVDRQSLMEAVWEVPHAISANALEVLVNGLRAKLDGGFPLKLLLTVRGVGYRLQSSRIASSKADPRQAL